YDLYLAGRAKVRRRGTHLREAIEMFEAAIARDSSWAPAWAALAEAHELRSWYPAAWDEEPADLRSYDETLLEHQAAAERAARRALILDPDLASARIALGSVHRTRREWEAAEREYLRALALDPDNAEAHQQYSEMLSGMGRIAEAVASAERAVRLDPAPIRHLMYGGALYADDRPAEAFAQLREGIRLDPDADVPQMIAWFYLMALAEGRLGEAEEALELGLPTRTFVEMTRAQHDQLMSAMTAGDPRLVPPKIVDQWPVTVMTWTAFGDRARPLGAIERSLAENPRDNPIWLWFPILDSLRDEPRFRAALRLLNLEDPRLQRTPRSEEDAP
ncbi:MAG: tetratricopeptide repeat protein, partial [Gemmatimonadota bacterium]